MNRYTSDQLAAFPWIVSNGTLRSEDLLPTFWQTAEQLSVSISADTFASLERLVGEDSSEADWSDEEASETLQELFDALDSVAPAGFGFGASEGDGACFGFWLGEDWQDAMEHMNLGNDDPAGWAVLIAELIDAGIDPDTIEDSYCGRAEGYSEERAGADYAQELAEELGVKLDQMQWPLTCVDWDSAWRELEMGDGYRLHSLGGGDWLVFRSV
jgi:hypothetical protein